MPKRSTRDKIRFQLDKAAFTLGRPLEHLREADILANGRQPILSDTLSPIVASIDAIQKVILKLRESV